MIGPQWHPIIESNGSRSQYTSSSLLLQRLNEFHPEGGDLMRYLALRALSIVLSVLSFAVQGLHRVYRSHLRRL